MRRRIAGALSLMMLAGTISGCAVSSSDSGYLVSPDETYETTGDSSDDYQLEDNDALYEDEDDTEVITMYLTVGWAMRRMGQITPGQK